MVRSTSQEEQASRNGIHRVFNWKDKVNEDRPRANAANAKLFLTNAFGKRYHTYGALGLEVYGLHAEAALTAPKCTVLEQLVEELGALHGEEKPVNCVLTLVNQAMGILQQELPSDRVSIDNIVSQLAKLHKVEVEKEPDIRARLRHLVFFTIGLAIMLFEPRFNSASNIFQVFRHSNQSSRSQSISIDISRRPISALLNGLGVLHHTNAQLNTRSTDATGFFEPGTEALVSANISYSALNGLGRVSVEWVDSLDAHLELDTDRRTLSLFRFPSFCTAAYAGGADCLLAKITTTTAPSVSTASSSKTPVNEMDTTSLSLCREVLRTYRLLFAHDKKSRALYWKTIRPSAKELDYDSLLDDLCGRKMSNIRSRHENLSKILDVRGGVFLPDEFSAYNQRLVAIQSYLNRHRHRRLLEVWKDRRDPEKFFTFWAVIIFGSATIILSLVQIGFNAAQLWVSYEQLLKS